MDGRRDLEAVGDRPRCRLALRAAVLCWLAAALKHAMPNRGPVVLSVDEVEALLDALPMPRKESDGEDADERKQIKTLEAARVRLQELKNSLDEGA